MSEINHAQRAHSALGASSSDRWMNCSGSVHLLSTLPPDTSDNPYAKEGTCAHELAEKALMSDNKRCKDFIGQVYEGHEVTAEMAEYVQQYVDYIMERTDGFTDTLIEERFTLSSIRDDMFGTNDCCIVRWGESIEVIDLKYGKGLEVEAEDNSQLMYYALGVVESLGDKYYFQKIILTIIQPRVNNPIKTWEITPKVLEEFRETLVKSVKRIDTHPANYVTGSHCKFCRAKAICPSQKAEVTKALGQPIESKQEVTFPPLSALTIDQMVNIVNNSKKIKEYVDSIEDYIKSSLMRGESVPQYKLVEGRANRELTSESEFLLAYEEEYGLALFTEPKLKSVAQLEKVIPKDKLKSFIKISKGISLAHESSKKPAINVTNGDLFKQQDLLEDF